MQKLVKTELITVKKEVIGTKKQPRNHYRVLAFTLPTVPDDGYMRVQRELIDAAIIKVVGPSAWAVYVCLLRHSDARNVAFPSQLTLSRLAGVSRNTVSTSVQRLQEVGLIQIRREQRPDAKHFHNVYVFDSQTSVASNLHSGSGRPALQQDTRLRPKSEQRYVQILGRKYLHSRHQPDREMRATQQPKGAAEVRHDGQCDLAAERSSGAAMVSPCGQVLGMKATREERVLMQLCLHLGGEAAVAKLLATPTSVGGLPRRRWLSLTSKVVARAVQDAADQAQGDDQTRILLLIALLDARVWQNASKKTTG